MKKDKSVLFKSKEYGLGGHNKLELRLLGNDGLRIWVKDGDVNALITMDRRDFESFAEVLTANTGKARAHEKPFDFTKPVAHKSSGSSKKVRKSRSDKGLKRKVTKGTKGVRRGTVGELVGAVKDIDIGQIKAKAITEAM